MSRRVRHTSGTAEEAQPAGSRAGIADPVASTWNAAFHGLSAEDRARVLALALPGGVVYAQQLPDPKVARKSDERPRTLFAPFLNGQSKHLEPTQSKPIEYFDSELDRWQREAVARALATVDLFLLRGHPGSGKSRVLVETLRQAIGRGDRVLFLARHPAALDRALSALTGAVEHLAVRFPHPGETEQQIRPEIREIFLERQAADLAIRARRSGQQDLAASQLEREGFERAQASLPVLVDLLAQKAKLATDQSEIKAKQTTQARELDTLSDSNDTIVANGEFAHAWSHWKDETARKMAVADAALEDISRQLSAHKTELAKLSAENAQLSPLLLARSSGRFWTRDWWTAKFNPAQTERAVQVAKLLDDATAGVQQQERSLEAAGRERQRLVEQAKLDRNGLLGAERARWENLFSAEIAALDAKNAELTRRWQEQCRQLPHLPSYSLATQDYLERATKEWADGQARAHASILRAKQWLELLEQHPQALRDALIEHASLIAATAAGWSADPGLANRLASRPFDLLVLEEAEQFTEPECATYARLARRWLFVGSDYLPNAEIAAASQAGPENRAALLPLQPPAFFGQLWQRLHSNPESLPYSWVENGDKLICRLRPIIEEQRSWIETERLVDYPQIVLHILALPRSQPVVAEVVFPATFTIQKAKQFILQELQELAVHAPARSMRWQDDHSDRLVLQLAGDVCHHPATVPLAPGIREMLNPRENAETNGRGEVAWQTCCIEFDRQSGWHRGAAEEWIERYLGLRDKGRTLFLDTLHRFTGSLSEFTKALIASQSNQAASVQPSLDQTLEFVAVPPLKETGRAEPSGGSPRFRPAGVELDLSEPKNRDRLPIELGIGLPTHGVVNLPEAQAIVRKVVEFERAGLLPPVLPGTVSVFVVALYEAQAELIRRLLCNSPSLASRADVIEVGVPHAFAHRDAAWVFVSLTRSHSHRSTAFGAGPKELLLALTRAREKMCVFGDVGALTRRAHWEGTVERLDELQTLQERDLIRTLLDGFQKMAHSRTAAVGSEGSGS
jgi:AAA domain